MRGVVQSDDPTDDVLTLYLSRGRLVRRPYQTGDSIIGVMSLSDTACNSSKSRSPSPLSTSDSHSCSAQRGSPGFVQGENVTDSVFGIKGLNNIASINSIAESSVEADGVSERGDLEDAYNKSPRRRSTLRPSTEPRNPATIDAERMLNGNCALDLAPHRNGRLCHSPSVAPSSTTISIDSQDIPSSLSSSPKSRSSQSCRHLDGDQHDDIGSQAIASSEEDGPDALPGTESSAPLLIMPSIKMPSRRPFTERGKAMGRLKILIAGRKGLGKTSLIKSMVQLSEDIVHVETFPNSPSASSHIRSKSCTHKANSQASMTHVRTSATTHEPQVSEIFASTKPYPDWWSGLEDKTFLPRPESVGDSILERNICFVDVSHGQDSVCRMGNSVDHIIRYMVAQLSKTLTLSDATENDLVSLLGGSGGSQVDLVLYLITPGLLDGDLAAIKRLSRLTNILILLAKSDLLSPSGLSNAKDTINTYLTTHSVDSFSFPVRSSSTDVTPAPPYAVCSALSPDSETMDASVLMSPDYVQPIQSSDLGYLISLILEPRNMSKLRYVAASKLLRNHQEGVLSRFAVATSSKQEQRSYQSRPSYLQARISAHTAREETFAQARLAKWATDLQRGLAQERSRYEALANQDRATWLEEQINSISSTSPSTSEGRNRLGRDKKMLLAWNQNRPGEAINVDDPLGLVRFTESATKYGCMMLSWMGVGAVTGIMLWAYRNWDPECLGLARIP